MQLERRMPSWSILLTAVFTREGQYNISTQKIFYYVLRDSSISSFEAQVSSHSTKISGNFSATSTSSHLRKRAVYIGYASDEKADIQLAITGASPYATGARDYLLQTLAGTHRYIFWFGDCNVNRKSTVTTHFANIADNDFQAYTYDCTCDLEDVYAYVNRLE
ncbi:hypothetical protein D9613_009113 [Agrocybe pediades]|uniref:Lysine-specific metallo-endopeptidase domain-containing protein n=1 Tax=Agrocybe pediades TaxID=84607 RepID=A0A8H4VTY9_9AGAR|nr:hypothetical protein D9613_009113 [Agrocybe pediades]